MLHPLHQFIYCPKCGAKSFVEHNEKSKQCKACGFIYYFNPSSAVACFIRNPKNELLLVRRGKEPGKGTLDTPGGFVDMFESGEEAVHREVMEETGLNMTDCRYLFSLSNIYLYCGFEVHTLDMFFECKTNSFEEAKAADDAAEIVVLPIELLNKDDFGLQSVKEAVEKYKNEYANND